jgi:hypothetical protein
MAKIPLSSTSNSPTSHSQSITLASAVAARGPSTCCHCSTSHPRKPPHCAHPTLANVPPPLLAICPSAPPQAVQARCCCSLSIARPPAPLSLAHLPFECACWCCSPSVDHTLTPCPPEEISPNRTWQQEEEGRGHFRLFTSIKNKKMLLRNYPLLVCLVHSLSLSPNIFRSKKDAHLRAIEIQLLVVLHSFL